MVQLHGQKPTETLRMLKETADQTYRPLPSSSDLISALACASGITWQVKLLTMVFYTVVGWGLAPMS